ncbi:hypothetical protein V6N13_033430 [Hibiscus sabdariffa]
MAILTASFCSSSFMSALLMMTFLDGGEVIDSAVTVGESIGCRFHHRSSIGASPCFFGAHFLPSQKETDLCINCSFQYGIWVGRKDSQWMTQYK